jgi:hypothetical protein
VADLVHEGINGYAPGAGDIEGLSHALQRLVEDDDLRRRQGQVSLTRIQEWGYAQCLTGIRAALTGLQHASRESRPVSRAN